MSSDAAGDDGSADADASAAVYGDFTDVANWSSFDLTTLNPGAGGYEGSAFDGRYLYLVPSYYGMLHGLVARYDTQAPFAVATSWKIFDTSTIDPTLRGFNGALFDGHYLYLVPHQNLAGYSGAVARYDTQAPFDVTTSWQSFNVATVDANAVGFFGARSDGRYVYMIPYVTGVMARYDTQQSFVSASAWTTLDLTTIDPNVPAYNGGIFDGRYLYMAPFINSTTASGLVMRYDTQAPFPSATSWTTFDATTVNANALGFAGAAFDGRNMYLVPLATGSGINDTVVKFDTTSNFTSPGSWSAFGATTIDPNAKGLFGAAFDGRYIYMPPYPNNIATRYDTTLPFTAPDAWRTFDVKMATPGGTAFYGAAFDGAAVYFVPHGGSTIMRFNDKTPPSMPSLPGYGGSFL